MDSRRSILGIGEVASEADVLWFWGLGTPSKEYCDPSLLTSFKVDT